MKPRFAFVLPLRNPAVAKDWNATVSLCVETLRSLSNTENADHEIVLVCKDFPDIEVGENITILRQPFPDPQRTWEAQHHDKYAKIKMGLAHLHQKQRPYYIMKFDADDIVSNKLASFVMQDDNRVGYYLESGYILNAEKRLALCENDFHKRCGSSNILFAQPDMLPHSMKDDTRYDLLTQGHNIVCETFARRNTPLTAIPFPAAIYRTATGENITAHYAPARTGPENRKNWKFYAGQAMHRMAATYRSMTATKISPQLAAEFSLNGSEKIIRTS